MISIPSPRCLNPMSNMSNYYDSGHMLTQQNNNHAHQMKMCLERRFSLNTVYNNNSYPSNPVPMKMNMCVERRMSLTNNRTTCYPTNLAPSPTQSIYWNDEANPHRQLDRSQSTPCDSTTTEPISTRYKTELCRPFEEKGYCKYSDKCQFAHGERELKSISRHPKYKTDLCQKYHTEGFCGYGTRCNFIHNENERTLTTIASKNQEAIARQNWRKQEVMARALPGPIQRPSSIGRPASSLSDSSPLSAAHSPSLSPSFLDSDEHDSYVMMNNTNNMNNTMNNSQYQLDYNNMNIYHHHHQHQQQQRDNNNSPTMFTPTAFTTAPATTQLSDNISRLANMSNLLCPLYVHTQPQTMESNVSHINTQLNNQNNNDSLLDMNELASQLSEIVAPHSPPDSISGDSLSSSGSSGSLDFTGLPCASPDSYAASLRLPVFTQFM